MELKEITATVAQKWRFDDRNYPRLWHCGRGNCEICELQFKRRHVAGDLEHALDEIKYLWNEIDHTKDTSDFDPDYRQKAIRALRNILVNLAQLLDVEEINPEEIELSFREWAQKRP